MSRRRDDLRALFAGGEPAPEQKALIPAFLRGDGRPAASASPPPAQPRAASGALKAMGLELDGLRDAAREAEDLKARLASGDAVVEVDPDLIDPAFVRDRMAGDPAADAALEASLASSGQQVPALLRPHPTAAGRYEAVYGHRRVAALRRLGKPVRAIVRALSDEALVVAQGQENNQRRDLSFIERARFAAALAERGFARATVMAALDAHTADLTRYKAVTDALSPALVEAIGPAPGIGRPRWLALAAAMPPGGAAPAAVRALLASADFRALGSDERFAAVAAALREKPAAVPSPAGAVWKSGDGKVEASLRPKGRRATEMKLVGPDSGAFAEFVSARLDDLFREFRRNGRGS